MNANEETGPSLGPRRASHPLLDFGALAVTGVVILMVAPVWIWFSSAQLDQRGAPPAFELLTLVGAALLTISLSLIQIFMHIRTFGGPAVRSNRDGYPVASGFTARLARAHANSVENLIPFAAIVLSAQALGVSNRWTVSGAALFLTARVVHSVAYAAGVTIVRSAAFYVGVIGTVLVAAQLPWLSNLYWR